MGDKSGGPGGSESSIPGRNRRPGISSEDDPRSGDLARPNGLSGSWLLDTKVRRPQRSRGILEEENAGAWRVVS